MNLFDLFRNIKSEASHKLEGYGNNPELVNVGNRERILSLAGGALLSYYGLKKIKVSGLFTALAGGALMFRGITGYSAFNKVTGINTASTKHQEKIPRSFQFKKDTFSMQEEAEGELKKQLKPAK